MVNCDCRRALMLSGTDRHCDLGSRMRIGISALIAIALSSLKESQHLRAAPYASSKRHVRLHKASHILLVYSYIFPPSLDRRAGWEGISKGALADEALQLWDQAEALLEERVDGQRLAEGGERLAWLVLLDANEANACKRTKVPGLQRQHAVAVSKRAVVFADEVEHGGALVPALGPIWQAGHDVVEDRHGHLRHAAHEQDRVLHLRIHLGVTRLQPQTPDLGHQGVRLLLDFGALEGGK